VFLLSNEIKAKRIFKGLKFYDVLNVAKILDITPGVVRQYLREKRIKAVKIGSKWWVSEKSINAFLGGGSFWDQSNDKIMDSINQAIKLTFESNVPWLAKEVKRLIIEDLTEIMAEKFKIIDEKNKQFSGKVGEHFKRRTEGAKKEFSKV
jgi:predicted transcriptional regulator